GGLEARWRRDLVAGERAALDVADRVGRGPDVGHQSCELVEHPADGVGVGVAEGPELREIADRRDVVEDEPDVVEGRLVVGHAPRLPTGRRAPGAPGETARTCAPST